MFSAGDSFDEALKNTTEVIGFYLEDFAESGKQIPNDSKPDKFANDADYKNAIWMMVEFDISAYLGKASK